MTSIFDHTSRANPFLLAERLFREQFNRNKFGQWVAPQFVKTKAGREEVGALGVDGPKTVGAPIELHEEFVKMGRDTLDIPVVTRLTEMPRHGEDPMKGTGERARLVYRTVRINYTRKAYTVPTGMSAQRIKQYADTLVEGADSFLRRWVNDYHPGNLILTMCAGYGRDLLAPVGKGGIGQSIVSHPNFFTGAGQVSYAGGRPGSAGYEASVASALQGITSATGFQFGVQFIENLVFEARRLKIAPIVIEGGFEFYPIWVSDSQWKQLQRDEEFRDWYKRLPEALAKHPLATGAEAFISGAAIYTDFNLFGAWTEASPGQSGIIAPDTVQYGPRPNDQELADGFTFGNWIQNLDPSDLKVGLLVGEGAMSIGVGERPSFTEQLDDHGMLKEIGIQFIQTPIRSDIYDFDGLVAGLAKGDFYQNTSSLAFATNSPHNLGWLAS